MYIWWHVYEAAWSAPKRQRRVSIWTERLPFTGANVSCKDSKNSAKKRRLALWSSRAAGALVRVVWRRSWRKACPSTRRCTFRVCLLPKSSMRNKSGRTLPSKSAGRRGFLRRVRTIGTRCYGLWRIAARTADISSYLTRSTGSDQKILHSWGNLRMPGICNSPKARI